MATVKRQYAYIKKTTTTGKQNWEITVHYFRYLNCFLKKTNLTFLPQVKRKDEVYLFPTFDPLKQLLTESWQNANFISLAHNTAENKRSVTGRKVTKVPYLMQKIHIPMHFI